MKTIKAQSASTRNHLREFRRFSNRLKPSKELFLKQPIKTLTVNGLALEKSCKKSKKKKIIAIYKEVFKAGDQIILKDSENAICINIMKITFKNS